MPPRLGKIAPNPLPQTFGFAYINDLPVFVQETIYSWLIRKLFDLVYDYLLNVHHLVYTAYWERVLGIEQQNHFSINSTLCIHQS